MDKEEIERILARTGINKSDLEPGFEPHADDGFEIARALLQVLGRRLGLGFVLETQSEVLKRIDDWSRDDDPHRRADAEEMRKVADAGYFTDLIDELSERGPSGRA